jgi:AraC-like DNA-binding protein
VWFCRGPIDGDPVEKKHVELVVLKMMIATVRLVAGPGWQPREIRLQTGDRRGVEEHPDFSLSDLRFGNPTTTFEIPSFLLTQRMPPTSTPPSSRDYERLETDIVNALRHAIASLPTGRDWNMHCVAEAVGMRPRTLQRSLSQADTTFSALVEDVRMSTAMSMLADTSMTVRDIAMQLRYADQANFTRAFRRWTGVSPQEYRRQRSTDRPDKTA